MSVRFRFAPSPSGNLHMGNAQTAYANWLCAKKLDGEFIVRVDDTDKSRVVEGSIEGVLADMQWLGLDHSPKLFYQSKRTELYNNIAEGLKSSGALYACFCTSEELVEQRQALLKMGKPPRYMGKWATASKDEVTAMKEAGKPYTWRLHIPEDRGTISWTDVVRGKQNINAQTLGDFIVLREDGSATYNFASIIDDMEMSITHVMRGEDHAANTPKQILLAEVIAALPGIPDIFKSWNERLKFAHIPIVLGMDKSKLSKRNGSKSIAHYREAGYLAASIRNALSLLIWSPPAGKEVLTDHELLEIFNLEKLAKSPSVFDEQKLTWLNSRYLKKVTDEDQQWSIAKKWIGASDPKIAKSLCSVFWPELNTLSELEEKVSSVANKPTNKDQSSRDREVAQVWLDCFDSEFSNWLKLSKEKSGAKGKELFMPLRKALTGQAHGLELTDISRVLGEPEVKARLQSYISS